MRYQQQNLPLFAIMRHNVITTNPGFGFVPDALEFYY